MYEKCVEVTNRCLDKLNRDGIDSLTKTERIVVLVNRADFNILNGGFSTFYYNSIGDDAIETIDALKQIGAMRAAQAIENANTLFSTPYPQDRVKRFSEWKNLANAKPNPLSNFEADYFSEESDVWIQLCHYIESH